MKVVLFSLVSFLLISCSNNSGAPTPPLPGQNQTGNTEPGWTPTAAQQLANACTSALDQAEGGSSHSGSSSFSQYCSCVSSVTEQQSTYASYQANPGSTVEELMYTYESECDQPYNGIESTYLIPIVAQNL